MNALIVPDTGCEGCNAVAVLNAQGLCSRCIEAAGRVCVGCGCDDGNACPGGCEWVSDNLCSRCAA